MPVYRIAKFDEVFTKSEGRRLSSLPWVSFPTQFSSNGYQTLLDDFDEDDAPAIYGVWCALVQFAARCNKPGVLANHRGRPLKLAHISRVTGLSVRWLERLLDWAMGEDVGWVEVLDESEIGAIFQGKSTSGDAPGNTRGPPPGDSPGCAPGTSRGHEQNRTEQDNKAAAYACAREDPASAGNGHMEADREAAALDFDLARQDPGRFAPAAKRLADAIRKRGITPDRLSADWIWRVVVVGELVRPGFVVEAADRIDSRDIEKPRQYLEKTLREECRAVGVALTVALKSVPEYRERVSS